MGDKVINLEFTAEDYQVVRQALASHAMAQAQAFAAEGYVFEQDKRLRQTMDLRETLAAQFEVVRHLLEDQS